MISMLVILIIIMISGSISMIVVTIIVGLRVARAEAVCAAEGDDLLAGAGLFGQYIYIYIYIYQRYITVYRPRCARGTQSAPAEWVPSLMGT